MGKKKSGNNIQKANTKKNNSEPKKPEIKYEAQPDVQLTAYTLIAMLAIAVSGATTAIGGAILANPIFYGMEAIYKKNLEKSFIEVLSEVLFEGDLGTKIKVLLIVSVVLVGIAAIVSLFDMIRAMNPENKPMPLFAWLALALSIAAVVLYVIASIMIYDNSSFADIEKGINFNLYTGAAIAHIVNIIFMITNIVGNYMGLKRFEKDGKAY